MPIIEKTSDFTQKMKNIEQWDSSPFLIFEGTYEVYLIVYTGGYGDNEGITCPSTRNLQMKRQIFTLDVLNQLSGINHQLMILTEDDMTVVKFPKFITHVAMFSHHGNYLMENTLFFTMSFEDTDGWRYTQTCYYSDAHVPI